MNDNNEQHDRLHELLCKVVFGEATAAETTEVEAALEASSTLRAQKAEIEGTVALVRGAYSERSDDRLSSERFDAVVAAAASDPTDGVILGGVAWFRRPLVRAVAVLTIVVGAGGVWWQGRAEPESRADVTVAGGDLMNSEDSSLPAEEADVVALDTDVQPVSNTIVIGSAAAPGALLSADELDDRAKASEAYRHAWSAQLGRRNYENKVDPATEGAFIGNVTVDKPNIQLDESFEFVVAGLAGDAGETVTSTRYSAGVPLLTEAGDASQAGRTYRGAGDSVPPGGGHGGGSADPGRPGPVGPSTPRASTAPDASSSYLSDTVVNSVSEPPVTKERVQRSRKKTSPEADHELVSRLAGLGYGADPVDTRPSGGRSVEPSSDDFFLGRGESRETYSGGATWCRVSVPPKRLPNERPRDMFFRFWGDNPYVITDRDAQSTFAADVDTASFSLARRMLREGFLPPREQVRTEEFVNFAKPDLAPPVEGAFAIHGELAPSPFGGREDRWLLRVGVRAAEIQRDQRPPLALTFVVDTSGSMRENNRLELVKHAIRLLVGELDARDSIALVRFSSEASEILAPTSAAARDVIETALFQLQPGGSTNAEAGLKLGYGLAERMLMEGTQTRVVFLSDGVANVGQTDQDRIANDVASSASRGIFLNTIGVGMANHNDAFLEQMANNGQGVCDYVGDASDARRAIVERFVGNFVTIAKDVKIQVEFDANKVLRWRQLGYENRAVADKDFRNDAIDAGEIGAGHQVVCLYEIELPSGRVPADTPLATVRLRWKPVTTGEAQPQAEAVEIERPLAYDGIVAASFRAASTGFRRAALSAQLAECLRRSTHARGDSMRELGKELAQLLSEDRVEDTAMIADMTKRSIDLGLEALIPTPTAGDPEDQHRQLYYDALIDSLGGADEPVESGSGQATYESRIRALLERDHGQQGH